LTRRPKRISGRAAGKGPGAVNHFRPHPWHGLEVGPHPPELLNAYIEITPFDLMKYEVDKVSGYLRVDRPQRSSAQHPTLYGFVPRTYCGDRVRRLAPAAKRGNGDPLDICVLSEPAIARNEIIVRGRVIGGLQMAVIYAIMSNLAVIQMNLTGMPRVSN
jgi:inorganic pyrophosphatase